MGCHPWEPAEGDKSSPPLSLKNRKNIDGVGRFFFMGVFFYMRGGFIFHYGGSLVHVRGMFFPYRVPILGLSLLQKL